MVGLGTPRQPDDIKLADYETFEAYCTAIREACEMWGMRIPLYKDPYKIVACLICGLPETGPLTGVKSSFKEFLRDSEYHFVHRHLPYPPGLRWDNVVRVCKGALEAYKRQVAGEGMADTSLNFEMTQ